MKCLVGRPVTAELDHFFEELYADVQAEASVSAGAGAHALAFRENAFTRVIMNDLEVAGVLEAPVACYCASTAGRGGFKVNGYGFPSEDSRLDLIVCDFRSREEDRRLNASDVDRHFSLALRFLRAAVDGYFEKAEPGHEEHAMLHEIFTRRGEFDRVHVTLVTNGEVVQRKERERREESDGYEITYAVWDLERLRRFRSAGAEHEPLLIDVSESVPGGVPCVRAQDADLGYLSCVAVLPGMLLYDLYDAHGPRLLELNVRSYLQAKGKINKGILETLLTAPKDFLAYNNGITIVAEGVEFDETGTRVLRLAGPQIVNGGQTTASIHRARKQHKSSLEHVFVQAKITVVPPGRESEMVPAISRLSNTQNKVSVVDLGANSPFQTAIERLARRIWAPGEQSRWFYERARGGYQTERARIGTTKARAAKFEAEFPVGQRITKEDAARYCNTWDELPHLVSRGGQKNFEWFMNNNPLARKGADVTNDDFRSLVARTILFRRTQDVARELRISAFGIHIVTYTVSLLAHRTARQIDLDEIWDRQALTTSLTAQIRGWLPKVGNVLLESAGGRNPTEWFKSEQCWVGLKAEAKNWDLSDAVVVELRTDTVPQEDVSSEGRLNIARCMQADASDWQRVVAWGSVSGELKDWQLGIAGTLLSYAAQKWARKPSEKQAKYGAAMLEEFTAKGETEGDPAEVNR